MFTTILLYTAYVMGAIFLIQISIPLIGYILYGAYIGLSNVTKWIAHKITGPRVEVVTA